MDEKIKNYRIKIIIKGNTPWSRRTGVSGRCVGGNEVYKHGDGSTEHEEYTRDKTLTNDHERSWVALLVSTPAS